MAFGYYSPVTVQTGQVPSTQSNFPTLVYYTDTRLKTVGNGGHVQNANGYDIRPYSDSALTSAMTFELESYDATNGIVAIWVNVPSLADASVIYLAYGDSSISTNGSSSSTWDSNYVIVYHLNDNAANTTVVNSASGGTNGTSTANTSSKTTTGQINGALTFNGSNDAVTNTSPGITQAPFTFEAWISLSANGNFPTVVSINSGGSPEIRFSSSTRQPQFGLAGTFVTSGSALSTGTLHHLVGTAAGTNPIAIHLYVDGTDIGNDSYPGTSDSGTEVDIGQRVGGAIPFPGTIDEARISNIARSANWVTTEYNNQSAPSTFAVLGTEVATSIIAFDAASNSTYQAASSSYSWSHTCTGSNRYLVVGVGMLSLAQTVTSITYNSVAMTFLGAQNSITGAARVELWGLIAPSTGSNTIAVTLSGSIASAADAVSYTGVHQTSPTEGFNSAQATNVGAADATVNVTTVADQDWVVDIVATDDTAITVGAGQTQRNNVTGTGGSAADSDKGPKTPAGSVTMSWTNVGALNTWSIGAIALRPITASGLGRSNLTLLGVS